MGDVAGETEDGPEDSITAGIYIRVPAVSQSGVSNKGGGRLGVVNDVAICGLNPVAQQKEVRKQAIYA